MVVTTDIPLDVFKTSTKVETDKTTEVDADKGDDIITSISNVSVDKDTMSTIKIVGVSFILAFFISWLLFFLLRPEWAYNLNEDGSSSDSINIGKTVAGGLVVGLFVAFLAYAFIILYRTHTTPVKVY